MTTRRWSHHARIICLLAVLAAAGCQSGGLQGRPTDPAANAEMRTREASELAIKGKTAADKGNIEEAIELNRQALSLDPSLAGAWNNLGVLLMQQQNYLNAIEAFGQAAKLLPADPRPYENIAIAYRDNGYSVKALEYFNRSLERDPNWLNSLRGTVACAQELNLAERPMLEQIRRGLMIESDPQWRAVFSRAKLRVETELNQKPAAEPTY